MRSKIHVKKSSSFPFQHLRCVFCHDSLCTGELHAGNCPYCQVCFHSECHEGSKQCPTLGCHAKLDGTWHSSVKLTPKLRTILSRVIYAVQKLFAVVVAMAVAIVVSLSLTTILSILAYMSYVLPEPIGAICTGFLLLVLFFQFPFSLAYIFSKLLKIFLRHTE
jgi:hypothetical protein